jgi:hypothetical protein
VSRSGRSDYQADTIADDRAEDQRRKTALVTSAARLASRTGDEQRLVLRRPVPIDGDAEYDSSEAPTVTDRPF